MNTETGVVGSCVFCMGIGMVRHHDIVGTVDETHRWVDGLTEYSVDLLVAFSRRRCTLVIKIIFILLGGVMELHHKLRRDPSWHPNSCNICGQLGHQAATCSTGTVNWKTIYGPRAFLRQPTVFPSDLDRALEKKRVNIKALEEDLDRYVQGDGGVMKHAKNSSAVQGGGARQVARPVQRQVVEEPDLPAGWAAAKDGQGKVYYWHKETKKVQWQRPTAE